MANNKKKETAKELLQSKDVELRVDFSLTKALDDFESMRINGGISIGITIKDEKDYEKQYKHWLKVIQGEVINQTYKYFRAVQKTKAEKLDSRDNEKK